MVKKSPGDKQIVNALNDYFANVGDNLASNIPTCTKSFGDYLKDPNPHSIFMQPTDSEELIKEINQMKNKRSALDIVKISMIKYVKEEITINKSIEEGVVTDLLKIAKVIPSKSYSHTQKKMMLPYQATTDQFHFYLYSIKYQKK